MIYGKYGWISVAPGGYHATFVDRDALESIASPAGRPSRPGEHVTIFLREHDLPAFTKALQIPKSPERREAWKKVHSKVPTDLENLGIHSTESLRKRGTILRS